MLKVAISAWDCLTLDFEPDAGDMKASGPSLQKLRVLRASTGERPSRDSSKRGLLGLDREAFWRGDISLVPAF